jgi:hypothetical protein
MNDDLLQRVMAIKTRHEAGLLKKANVLGVGIGFREQDGRLTDEVVLVVNVSRKQRASQLAPQDAIPSVIEGVPVDVRETGEIRAS